MKYTITDQHEKSLSTISSEIVQVINFLPDAAFAIDFQGMVIAWNPIISDMTGIAAKDMIGRGNYEYAIPFYGLRRPILIDLAISPDKEIEKDYPNFSRDKYGINGEKEFQLINNKKLYLCCKASPIYDSGGKIIGAIETIRDLTRIKETKISLMESEYKFKILSEKSLIGVYLYDPETRTFLYANPALAHIFECDVNELIHGEDLKRFVFPEDVPMIRKYMRKRSMGEIASAQYAFRAITKKGNIRHIEARGSAVQYKGKTAIIGTCQDITDRIKSINELHEARDYLESLIQHAKNPIIVFSPELIVTRFNAAFEYLTGYSKDKILGKNISILFESGKQKRIMSQINMMLEGQQFSSIEIPILCANGDERTIVCNSANIYDLDKNIISVIAQGEDITERKIAEEALQMSEERYRSLMDDVLDSSAVGMIILDVDFNIVWVNKALEKYFGIRRKEIIGQDKQQLVRNQFKYIFENPDSFAERVLATYDNNTYIESFECHVLPGNGIKERWLHHWSQPISSGLYSGGRIEHYTDITERKKADKKLKIYKDHLEKIVKERTQRIHSLENQRREIERLAYSGQVAARVAHEINNPLAGIKNSFLLIKNAVPKDHPYHHYMELIEKEIKRLACIVKQMFGLYKPDLITMKEFKFSDLINDIIELIESVRRERDVNIRVSANSISIAHIPESLLRQIIYNILINALEASYPDGEIIIQAKIVGTSIIISITDHGCGIPDEIKPHIFDPFYSTKKGEQKGLGLGLSITKKIIDELHGTISFESTKGSQTVFTIKLPVGGNQSELE